MLQLIIAHGARPGSYRVKQTATVPVKKPDAEERATTALLFSGLEHRRDRQLALKRLNWLFSNQLTTATGAS